MALLPHAVPSKYAGTVSDFLKAPGIKDGSLFQRYESVAVADNSSVGTRLGLIPFTKGFSLAQGATQLHVTDLDTGATVTLNVGYTYYDSAVAGEASDPDAFASLLSGQTAALLSLDEHAGLGWTAKGDGWLTVSIAGAAVTTAGTLKGQIAGTYAQ